MAHDVHADPLVPEVGRGGDPAQGKTVQTLAERSGATCVGTTHFTYLGGQVRSLLSLIGYLGTGEYQERYPGVKIPPTNLQPEGDAAAHTFAEKLVEQLPSDSPRP